MKRYISFALFSILLPLTSISCEKQKVKSKNSINSSVKKRAEPATEDENTQWFKAMDFLDTCNDDCNSAPLPRVTARISSTGMSDIYLDGKLISYEEFTGITPKTEKNKSNKTALSNR